MSRPTTELDRSETFSSIYKSNYWGLLGPKPESGSRSGTGSDLEQTAALRAALPALLVEVGARSMLDIPCGDFFWMQHCDLPVERYIGADIVEELMTGLQSRFGGGQREFRRFDLVSDELPMVDVVLCRDGLVHCSDRDAMQAIENIKRSGSRLLLATTFTARKKNPDIETGLWRPINLRKRPFEFPRPTLMINEKCTEHGGAWSDKSLGLWRIEEL